MFLIMKHYSNENISEFGRIHLFPEVYRTLDAAKKAVMEEFRREDEYLPFDEEPEPVHDIDKDVCSHIFTSYDSPECIIGRYDEDNFEGNHNIFAIFKVNMFSKKAIEPGKKYVFFFRNTDGDCKDLVKYNGRLCTVNSKSDPPCGNSHQGLYSVEFDAILNEEFNSDEYDVYGEELERVEDCIQTEYGIYILRN